MLSIRASGTHGAAPWYHLVRTSARGPRSPSRVPRRASARRRPAPPPCALRKSAKIDWRLPVRVRRARKAHQPPVDAADLLGLEVLEKVREDHSPRLAVEEDDLLHEPAAAEDKLLKVLAPGRVGLIAQLGLKGYVDALGGGSLPYPWRGPRYSFGVEQLPGADVRVVNLVGRDKVLNRP